jgi:hypothetical protein
MEKETVSMEPRKRRHYRIAVKDVHPTPADGIYVTKTEARHFCIFGAMAFLFLAILAVLPRKN